MRSDFQRTQSDIHCMFVEGKSKTVFFPSDTLIYGVSRDGSKNYNIRTCEHMILGQLLMGARQTKNAPLIVTYQSELFAQIWANPVSQLFSALQPEAKTLDKGWPPSTLPPSLNTSPHRWTLFEEIFSFSSAHHSDKSTFWLLYFWGILINLNLVDNHLLYCKI